MKKKIFLLGDSISLHYNPFLIPMTSDLYEWQTKEGRAEAMKDLDKPISANGGHSGAVLSFLRMEEELENLNYDYLLLNCGLHDIAFDPGNPDHRVPETRYRENLEAVVDMMKAHGIKVIWVTTTPVDDERHNARASFKRYNRDVLRYNAIAAEIMQKNAIPTIDLYAFTDALEGEKFVDHVHFLVEVREKHAAFLAKELEKIID